jgi:hypothetical protein
MSSITFRVSYCVELSEAQIIAILRERHDLNEKQIDYMLEELRKDEGNNGIDLSYEVCGDTLDELVTETAEEYINDQVSYIPDELATEEKEESENEDKEKSD